MAETTRVGERQTTWRNWYGNQGCRPARVGRPADESELRAVVAAACADGHRIRVAGSGHSNVPLVETDGVVVETRGLTGLRALDRAAGTATFGAGTTVAEIGAALWQHGLSLANQGDIDTQTIAGAAATGTHGSGVRLPCMSAAVRALRLVTGDGSVVTVDGQDEERLRAAQVSLGALGVVTELTLSVVEAFNLRLDVWSTAWEDLADRLPGLLAAHRGVVVYWCPHGSNPWAPLVADGDGGERVIVKTFDAVPASDRVTGVKYATTFTGPAHRVWPDRYEPDFHELEHMVAAGDTLAALGEVRELLRRRHPAEALPVEVRFVAADAAFLSPFAGRDSGVISISGIMGADNEVLFRDADAVLRAFDARPHWGKWHALDAARARAAFPDLPRFEAVRRELDPAGRFLNRHVAKLLGVPADAR